MAYLRDRRAFGNIGTRKFRGARFGDALSPRFSGLLDQYPGAAAAYSLRALSSGWAAGDVVRARRVNTPGEANFTAGQVANGELATWALSGDAFVTTWYDQSGNAKDATQATTTSQPKIVDAGALVVGGIDFDGVDDSLDLVNLFSGTTAVSMFCVGNADTTATSEAMFSHGANVSVGASFTWTSEIAFRPGGNTVYDDGFVSASTMLLSAIAPAASDSSDARAWLDSVELGQTGTTSAVLNYATEAATIGTNFGSGAAYDGRLTEIIVYNSDQSANRVGIETNINAAYSIF